MKRRPLAPRCWRHALRGLVLSVGCAVPALVAVPGVMTTAAPAGPGAASPAIGSARYSRAPGAATLTSVPRPGPPRRASVRPALSGRTLAHGPAPTPGSALTGAKPVPPGWPRPGERIRTVATSPPLVSPATAVESTNWSGYVDTGPRADFTEVSASWTVPRVSPSLAAYSASWVGIDGFGNDNLVQVGTEQDWDVHGVVYYAWYELIPSEPLYLGEVFPGDHISAVIRKVGTSTWEIEVADATRHAIWSGAVSYASPGTSAEWIEEAPTSATTFKVLTLAHYGSVEFTNLGVSGPHTAAAVITPVYMLANMNGPVTSYPSRYSPATDSFGIDYGRPSSRPTGFPGATIAPGAPAGTTTTSTLPAAPATSTTFEAVTTTTPRPPTTTVTTAATGGPATPTTAPTITTITTTTAAQPATTTTTAPTITTTTSTAEGPPVAGGYWLVGQDGGVFAFGSAKFYGSSAQVGTGTGDNTIVAMAPTADGRGYWLVSQAGGVFPFGDAQFYGSIISMDLTEGPVVGMAASPDGRGYYMLDGGGGVYAFGDAHFEGSCFTIGGCGPGLPVALLPDATGNGYWVLLSNCEMVPFGDAPLFSNFGCESYAAANGVSAYAAARAPDGRGYWVLLAKQRTATEEPAIYPEGDAVNYGDWTALAKPVGRTWAVALIPTDDGHGAWLVFADGTVQDLGDAPSQGGLAGARLHAPLASASAT